MPITNSGRLNPRWARRNAKPRWEWPQPPTNWDDQAEALLESSDQSESSKTRKLIELMPRLSVDVQLEVVDHMNQSVPDEEYGQLYPLFTNTATTEVVMDLLLAGVAERRDEVRLPLLLTAAQDPANPRSGEALDYLAGLVGEDYGTNWDQWNSVVGGRLRGGVDSSDQMAAGPP